MRLRLFIPLLLASLIALAPSRVRAANAFTAIKIEGASTVTSVGGLEFQSGATLTLDSGSTFNMNGTTTITLGSDATGDIYFNSGTGNALARLGIGTSGQILTVTSGLPAWSSTFPFSNLSGAPTTLSGYGITDPVLLSSGSYSNPAWLTGLDWSKITDTPNTFAGYGISFSGSATVVATNPGIYFTDNTYAMAIGLNSVAGYYEDGTPAGDIVIRNYTYGANIDFEALGFSFNGQNVQVTGTGGLDPGWYFDDGVYATTIAQASTDNNFGAGESAGDTVLRNYNYPHNIVLSATGGSLIFNGVTLVISSDSVSGSPTDTTTPVGWIPTTYQGQSGWIPFYQ